jgi:3-keto-disaccharide hydrolase/zinc-ribbon domain
MQCPNCGAFITAEDLFCGECGRPLSAAEPPGALEAKDLPTTELETPLRAPSPAPKAPPLRRKPLLLPALLLAGIALLLICVCGAGVYVWLRSDGQPPEVLATPSVPLYQDDFGDPSSGWDVFDEDDTLAEYANGEYRLGVYQDNYMAWGNPTPGQEFTDFQVEVDARQAEGPLDNNFGLLIHYQTDDQDFYWFEISGDGYYSVDMRQAGQWSTLVDWSTSDAINQGVGATNHLKVVCAGNHFSFYVNDILLTEMSDSAFSSGNIGLAVGTFDEPGVVVSFDNIRVHSLQD